MATGLNSTFSAPGVADIINFSAYPWGNAYYNTSECGVADYDKTNAMYCWINQCGVSNPPANCFNSTLSPILCQHGDNECLANLLEACVGSLTAQNASVAFTICFEGLYTESWQSSDAPILSAALQCATQVKVSESDIVGCYKGSTGITLNTQNAQATAKYGSSRLGTPWVVVNGHVLDDPVTELLGAVCSNYTGTKPAGCSQTYS